jgi:zinc D-Ala-D-Ala carboxypeptidase
MMIDWEKYYPYFQPHEFVCKCGCGLLNMREDHMDMLLKARLIADIPFQISSGCRCPSHNRKERGNLTSEHLRGQGTDITALTMGTREIIVDALKAAGFPRRGLHPAFVHAGSDRTRPLGIYLY